jgi:hypothetical protein
MPEVLFEELAVTAGDDVYEVLGIGAELLERLERRLGGDGRGGCLDDRRERAL